MKQVSLIGRRKVVTSEKLQKLREAFLMGFSDREACVYSGISKSTLYNFQEQYPEFLDQKETWKAYPTFIARKTIFEALSKDIKIAQWYLERKLPNEFGPAQGRC